MVDRTSYQVQPTPEQMAECQRIAGLMAKAIPPETSDATIIGALSLLCQGSFLQYVKAEYRVNAFESFAFHCRRQLVDSIRAKGGRP